MVPYCSDMMYKYDSSCGFIPIKKNWEGKEIHNEIFINIQHFIKKAFILTISEMVLLCKMINQPFKNER